MGMVFMSDRRAQQCEHAAAGEVHDIAVISVYRVDHKAQCGINNRARLLRVEVFNQFHRALDVGEQRRDRYALAIGRFMGICRPLHKYGSWRNPTADGLRLRNQGAARK